MQTLGKLNYKYLYLMSANNLALYTPLYLYICYSPAGRSIQAEGTGTGTTGRGHSFSLYGPT